MKLFAEHALIFNQNLLDFVNCFFMVITTAAKLNESYMHLSGALGYWFCTIVLSVVRYTDSAGITVGENSCVFLIRMR